MKKLMLPMITSLMLLLFMLGNVNAQKKYVNKALQWAENGEELDSALKLIQLAEKDEKTADWAKTYYAKAKVYRAMHKAQNQNHPDALVLAFDNFVKSYDLKGGGTIKTMIDGELIMMPNELANTALSAYEENDFSKAFKYFEKVIEIKGLELFGSEIDTLTIFNTALCALKAEDYDNAIKYYKKSIELGFGEGDTYALLAESYKKNKDTASFVSTLQEGFEKYPNNQSVMNGLINYFLLEAKDKEKGLEFFDYAIEKNPDNAQLYSGKAMFYDGTGDSENAKNMYKKALELNPELFEAQYNLGVLYFNEGVELSNKLADIIDNDKFVKAKKVADDKFKEALPYLEKAYELKPEDNSVGNTLRTLYYRLQMTEKYNDISEKLGY